MAYLSLSIFIYTNATKTRTTHSPTIHTQSLLEQRESVYLSILLSILEAHALFITRGTQIAHNQSKLITFCSNRRYDRRIPFRLEMATEIDGELRVDSSSRTCPMKFSNSM